MQILKKKKRIFFLSLSVFRYDCVIGNYDEHDEFTARVIEPHPLFGNNFDLQSIPKQGPVHSSVDKFKSRQDKGVFDVIFYLAAKLFRVSISLSYPK